MGAGTGRDLGHPSQGSPLMAAGDFQKDLMVLNDMYSVMATDALASSHPLSTPAQEVNTPAQISEMFDSISYSKVPPQLPRCSQDSGDHKEGGGGLAPRGLTAAGPSGSLVPAQWCHRILLAQHSLLSPCPPTFPREPRSSGCSPTS